MATDDEVRSPGWDAISAALDQRYEGQEPLHFGTMIPYALGGPDPLRGLSAYRRTDPDHWHIVTYGFTELDEKETDDPKVSGYGFELTMRVARARDEDQAPMWALNFLQNLGRYVFETGNVFGAGDHMPLNGPICQGAATAIHSMAVGRDPELGDFTSENGAATFLQVVGITNDELSLIMEWDTLAFLKEMSAGDPWLLTDLGRRSLLQDPVVAGRLRARAEADGSSMAFSHGEDGRFLPGPPVVWEVGAFYVNSVLRGLKGRTLHQRPYDLVGPRLQVHLVPDSRDACELKADELTLKLSPALAREIASTLKPARGDYAWPKLSGFILRVVPTEIKDQKGAVTEVVG